MTATDLAAHRRAWFTPGPGLRRLMHNRAFVSGVLLLAIVVAAIAIWYGMERMVARAGRRWIARGGRDGALAAGARGGAALFCALSAAAMTALAGMVL